MMRIRLAIEFRIGGDPDPEPDGRSGTESMIIHQDQPRHIGFRQEFGETTNGNDL